MQTKRFKVVARRAYICDGHRLEKGETIIRGECPSECANFVKKRWPWSAFEVVFEEDQPAKSEKPKTEKPDRSDMVADLVKLPELGEETAGAIIDAGIGITSRHRLVAVIKAGAPKDIERLIGLPGVTARRLKLWRKAG